VGLGSLTRPELIFPDLPAAPARDSAGVLRAFADRIAGLGLVPDADALFRKLWEREQLSSTGIGAGVAIPHGKLPGLRQGIVAVGLAPQGVDFGAADGQPVRLFFLVVSPEGAPAEHLRVLAAISRWIQADRHAERILELREPQEVYRFLQEEGS
jgi:PTS system nitrogen regulatory IIA component